MRISKQAIAFFRTANNDAASDSERATAQAKLNEYCERHGISVDAVADAVANDSLTPAEQRRRANVAAKPAPKAEQPKREAPKPEKPSKPANETKANDYAQRVELIDALRVVVAGLYNGPSLAVRTNPKRYTDGVYSALFAAPKHRTTLDKLTARDESALFLIIKRGERNGSFDPIHLNLDSGIFSRLASVGFIERDGSVYKLSADAIAHANLAAKRAA